MKTGFVPTTRNTYKKKKKSGLQELPRQPQNIKHLQQTTAMLGILCNGVLTYASLCLVVGTDDRQIHKAMNQSKTLQDRLINIYN